MTTILVKDVIYKTFYALMKAVFSIEIPNSEENINYFEILEIAKNMKEITSTQKLLLDLFSLLFFDGKNQKTNIENNLLEYFNICLAGKFSDKSLNEYLGLELKKLGNFFGDKNLFSKDEILIFSFIIKEKPDFNVFFKCFEDALSAKIKRFLPGFYKDNFSEERNFDSWLSEFKMIYLSININPNEYYSLTYEDSWFLKIPIKKEQLEEYNAKKEDKSFLINSLNSLTKNSFNSFQDSKPNINNNIHKSENFLNPVTVEQKKGNEINKLENTDVNKIKASNKFQGNIDNELNIFLIQQISLLTKNVDDCNIKISQMANLKEKEIENIKENHKKEINEYNLKFQNMEKDYNNKIDELSKKYNSEIKNIKDQNSQYISEIRKAEILNINNFNRMFEKQIKELNIQINILNDKNNKLSENISVLKISHLNAIKENNDRYELLEKKCNDISKNLNLIKSRSISKEIIDFMEYTFSTLEFNNKYGTKVNQIKEKIGLLEGSDKYNENLLKKIKKFLDVITGIKKTGDELTHDRMELKEFFELFAGFEDMKELLNKINFDVILDNFIEIYSLQFQKDDYSLKLADMDNLLKNKKNLFLAKIQKEDY